MSDLNTEIKKVFFEKEDIENKARELESRIKKIAGTYNLLPERKYGEPVNTAAIRSNITLSALIDKSDRELASYLGVVSNRHREEEEAKAARELQAEALRLATEKLRLKNENVARHRETAERLNIDPLTGRTKLYGA